MAAITAEDIVRLFEEDVRARRRLAELLVSEPDVRLALANAILREVATKDDLKELRAEMHRMREELRDEIYKVRAELKAYIDAKVEGLEKLFNARISGVERGVEGLEQRISDLTALVRASLIAITITLASTILTPLMLKLLGML